MTALTGAAAGLLWLARWMLVLALILDQASSPLHLHRHDSGIDAGWLQSIEHSREGHVDERHDARRLAGHHAHEHEPAAAFAHAVLAVRSQAEQTTGASDGDLDLALASSHQRDAVGTPQSDAHRLSVAPDRLVVRGHRGLHPEGRAPPLHA